MDELAKRAIEVLHGNDRGTWTRPSPRLYPHQWSWDAAFVAMGWAQLDPVRALNELWSLLRGQWATGMVPQIVFDLNVGRGRYEPGPNAWGTALNAPPGVATSGICQPPVHAIALGPDPRGGRGPQRRQPRTRSTTPSSTSTPASTAGTGGCAPRGTPRAPG